MKKFFYSMGIARLSPFTWSVAFFVVLLFVRGWFFVRGLYFPAASAGRLMGLILMGVLHDAFIVSCLILPFQWGHSILIRIPAWIHNFLIFILILFTALLSAYSFSSVEFFLRFGSHLNLDHIINLTESGNGVSLFVTSGPLTHLAFFYWVGVPSIYIFISLFFKSLRMDFFLRSKPGIWLVFFVVMGAMSLQLIKISDPLQANYVENSSFHFFKDMVYSNEFIDKKSGDVQQFLDSLPLPKPNENPQPWFGKRQ